MDALDVGLARLNDFQREILADCLLKGSGGLSLPMGSGKTLLSIVLGLSQTTACDDFESVTLAIVSKTLLASWDVEIRKFFTVSSEFFVADATEGSQEEIDDGGEDEGEGEDEELVPELEPEIPHPSETSVLKYQIVHQSVCDLDTWNLASGTRLVITTADVLAKAYKDQRVQAKLITQIPNSRIGFMNSYQGPGDKTPFMPLQTRGQGVFHSQKWGCLLVDEAQQFTNIETLKCQAIASICANNRWLLSGTLFNEPTPERILGYHVMLDYPDTPRTIPETKSLMYTREFKGLNRTLVHRATNLAFTTPPRIREHIITHEFSIEETKIYLMMKEILVKIKKLAQEAGLLGNAQEQRLFNSYKLVMIMYLRQSLICPLIPITSVVIDASNATSRSELSGMIRTEIDNLEIDQWLNNHESVKSTRIKAVLGVIDKHVHEKVVVFTCFTSFVDIIRYFLPKTRPVFTMDASLSINGRGDLLKEFQESANGILLLTYQLGAEGLNLQFASTVLLVDFWWNAAKTQQAIARIFRFGQISEEINVYFFSANTGIEEILFKKQRAKLSILEDLKTGGTRTKVPKLNLNQIIRMIEMSDNRRLLEGIYRTSG